MEKILKLYTYVDGVNDAPFPSSNNQIEIGSFDYNASRMGSAPNISATVMWESCLDNEWTKGVYAEFNGERYFLKQTPTSSYDNTGLMYEHNLELVSERIALDNVYFYDVVSGTPQEGDKPVSHSADFVFFGTIDEFAGRLNASLEYAGMDYSVVLDEGIESEAKQMSFSSQFFSNVLQEIYNTYELPYYFVGKTIHIGYTSNVLTDVFRYGVNDALLSISKNNANNKVVNRVTGVGGEENIPYYYPNDTPKACGVDVTNGEFEVQVVDGEALEANTKIGDVLTYLGNAPVDLDTSFLVTQSGKFNRSNSWQLGELHTFIGSDNVAFREKINFILTGLYLSDGSEYEGSVSSIQHTITAKILAKVSGAAYTQTVSSEAKVVTSGSPVFFDFVVPSGYDGVELCVKFEYGINDSANTGIRQVSYSVQGEGYVGWISEDWEDSLSSRELGLAITGTPLFGDTITVIQEDYINPQKALMPPIYRESVGNERFYNATNGVYEGYEFPNPYVEGHPVEQIVEFPDIKPTIKGVKNDEGQPIDEFLEFAFDINDNNEIDENGDYIHSHFFAKLPKMPFNLFDHAIENGEMTVNMTGGSLGGCTFVIAVSEEDSDGKQWNTVQVNSDGSLKRDPQTGDVICGVEGQGDVIPQESQNDTRYNEVWIALKKDANYTTFARPTLDATAEDGTVMLDAGGTAIDGKAGHYLPYEGTTFVYTNILLPKAYIIDAEERLKTAILDYMVDNNAEKFTFSIDFSRIYLAEKDAEDEDFLKNLNENARITIEYNGEPHTLYVSSYSYKMTAGELLPEISVELSEDLSVSQNAIQKAISEVKGDLLKTIGNMDVLAQGTPFFLRKDQRDRAKKTITFEEGLEVGKYSEGTLGAGASISIDESGSTHIEADYLKIRKKATFTNLTIQEMKSVGGEIVISPAAMVCSSVEELDNAYRCYFNTSDNDGTHIFNEFAVDDQARCQSFNVLGTKFYWRLVTAVGDNYIDLSKTDCATNSGIPQAGDSIVSLGNRSDSERQSAIVHSAYGEDAPSMTQYAGINSYDLSDKVVTKFSPKGNLITGKIHFEAGSSGVENLDLEIGAYNLLRNSGFTGDYLSETLTDESVLDAVSEMYSDPLEHWSVGSTSTVSVIDLSGIAASGKGVTISTGIGLSQNLYYNSIINENYVFSFKATSLAVDTTTTLVLNCGGVRREVSVEYGWKDYAISFVVTTPSNEFNISSVNGVSVCDLQLERGTIASSWGSSWLDNSSDRAYWQSMKYLQSAIAEGYTEVNGGLILTNHIQVGNTSDGVIAENTPNGGMNGLQYDGDDSVFLWGGGTITEAQAAVDKYKADPSYQPTDAELAEMAKFVVTHGGRAILNDMILRGYVYAFGGKIGDLLIADGSLSAESGCSSVVGEYRDYASFRKDRFSVSKTYNTGSACAVPNTTNVSSEGVMTRKSGDYGKGYDGIESIGYVNGFHASDSVAGLFVGTMDLDEESALSSEAVDKYSVYAKKGVFAGLRTSTRVVTADAKLSEMDYSILVNLTSGSVTLTFPSEPIDGQEYIVETKGADITISSAKNIYNHYNGNILSGSITDRGVIRFKYYKDASQWTMTWFELHQ